MREKTGKAEEVLDLPAGIGTVAELVTWLKGLGPEYAEAFARADVIRAAIDQDARQADAPASPARARSPSFRR